MRQNDADFDALGVAVLVITFEPRERAAAYVLETGLVWPLLLDSDRRVYRAFGMDRAPLARVWGPKTLLAYARLLAAGRKLSRATGDTRQRGGDVLIDPEQIVRLHHVGDGPADRPSAEEILATCRR